MDNEITLVLKKEKNLIEFTAIDYSEKIAHSDKENKIDYITKRNKVECRLYFEYEGWGFGGVSDVYVTTDDLKRLSDGFASLLSGGIDEFCLKTTIALFEIRAYVKKENYYFSFIISNYLDNEKIEISFEELSKKQIEIYADIFSKWATKFPVLTEDQLLEVYKEAW